MRTWNLSQASQACLCKVVGTGVKFDLEGKLFLLRVCLFFVQDLDTTITVQLRKKKKNHKKIAFKKK